MEFNILEWIISIFVIVGIIGFWSIFVYLTIYPLGFKGIPINTQTEGFASGQKKLQVHRTAELFNPSAYTGIFVRKFNTPSFYTRTDYTFPLYSYLNSNSTSNVSANLSGNPSNILANNVLAAPWAIQNVYPLKNRRLMLV